MVDPLIIIGAAASIGSILDVLGRTICIVAQLRATWQDAELAVLTLESQLAALRTALGKIKEWTETNFDDPHHQLVMDMDHCVACCRLLIEKIYTEMSRFRTTADDRLDAASRFKLLLKTKEITNIQRMIEQQTNALMLLLTACNMCAMAGQKQLLEQPQTRKIFKCMQDDTSSLCVHRDVDSFFSRAVASISSSKRSLVFDFDKELFLSRVYERWIRGSIKKSLRQQQIRSDSPETHPRYLQPVSFEQNESNRDGKARSKAIDRGLRQDIHRIRKEWKVLVLGADSRVKIVEQIRAAHSADGYSYDDRYMFRSSLFRKIIDDAKTLIRQAMTFDAGAPVPDPPFQDMHVIANYSAPGTLRDMTLDTSFCEALEAILKSTWMRELKRLGFTPQLPAHAKVLFSQIYIVASENYLPTNANITYAKLAAVSSIQETRVKRGSLSLRLLDLSGQQNEMKKWIYSFEDATAIIYVVDLDTYDMVDTPATGKTVNRMEESLLLFKSVITSQWFHKVMTVILLLANRSEFARKLPVSPLSNHFPHYTDGNDISKASRYILRRYSDIVPTGKFLYAHLVDSDNGSTLRFIDASVGQSIVSESLRMELNSRQFESFVKPNAG